MKDVLIAVVATIVSYPLKRLVLDPAIKAAKKAFRKGPPSDGPSDSDSDV